MKGKINITKIIIGVMFFIILISINVSVNATSISFSPENPKVGDTVTVTVSVSNVHTADVTANVSGVASGTIKVVGGDLNGNPSTISETKSFKCTKEGTLSVSISNDSTAVLNGEYVKTGASASIKIEQKKQENNSSSENDNKPSIDEANGGSSNDSKPSEEKKPEKTTEDKKSNNANLKNLGITPNDFKGFKAATTSYDIKVPNDVEQVKVYAQAQDSKAKVKGIGTQKLKVGKNVAKVEVEAEDGTTKTYTINITREEQNEEEKPEENKPEEEKKEDEKEEETTEQEEIKVSNKDLVKLEVTGYTLTPKFSPDIYEYKLKVGEDISSLDILTEGANENVSIDVVGNTELTEDENTITILVNNKETDETQTYQIVVTKGPIDIAGVNTALDGATRKGSMSLYIVIGVIVLILVGVVAFIIIRKRYLDELEIADKYEYDEEDEDMEDDESHHESLDLDEEEELFHRVNSDFFKKSKADKTLDEIEEDDDEIESAPRKRENKEDNFRTSKKGRHF